MSVLECGICLCNNTESLETFITLSCNHSFHYTCLNHFFNCTEYYKYKCCYCTKTLHIDDIDELNNFNDIIIKIKYTKLCKADLNHINIHTNNSELLLHCIMTNNLYNFNFLLNNDIDINQETVKNMITYSIKYENLSVIKFIFDNFKISKINLYLECINNYKYNFLIKLIDILSTNPNLSKKDILFKSIIDNNYELFEYFKEYLHYFNKNNINISIYFSLYHNNISMFKSIISYCKTNNIKYKNIVNSCSNKLNYNVLYKYIISCI